MKQYTKTLKKVHQIKINTEKSVSIKQESLQALPLLVGEGKILNNEEMEKIKRYLKISQIKLHLFMETVIPEI